jgi:hypothetical protein
MLRPIILQKTTLQWFDPKNDIIFAKFFGKSILKITTSVPDHPIPFDCCTSQGCQIFLTETG